MSTHVHGDSHVQLRALYLSLISHQEHFDEFKRMLAEYSVSDGIEREPEPAASVRARLNARIREWVGGDFEGLTASQTLQWKAIVVEERINVALSPWKESNGY